MDRIPVAPLKSSSFLAATSREEKLTHNLSLGPIKLIEHIKEAQKEKAAGVENIDAVPEEAAEPDLTALSAEIDAFLAGLRDCDATPAVSEVTLDKIASAVEQEITQSEGTDHRRAPRHRCAAPRHDVRGGRVPRHAGGPPMAVDTGRSMKRPLSFRHGAELDRCVVPTPMADASPLFPPETVGRLRAMESWPRRQIGDGSAFLREKRNSASRARG